MLSFNYSAPSKMDQVALFNIVERYQGTLHHTTTDGEVGRVRGEVHLKIALLGPTQS